MWWLRWLLINLGMYMYICSHTFTHMYMYIHPVIIYFHDHEMVEYICVAQYYAGVSEAYKIL